MRTLKTYSPFGLNIEECLTNPMQKYKCYWWAYLFVCFFFFLAYWLDQERIQNKIFWTWHLFFCIFYIAYFLIINSFYVTYFCVVLLLHYMLVLFPFSSASYCTVYLFIIFIYTIVKLNVLVLLCINTDSIACASYFIHCAILFDLQ